jgi:hypothetical protein
MGDVIREMFGKNSSSQFGYVLYVVSLSHQAGIYKPFVAKLLSGN